MPPIEEGYSIVFGSSEPFVLTQSVVGGILNLTVSLTAGVSLSGFLKIYFCNAAGVHGVCVAYRRWGAGDN